MARRAQQGSVARCPYCEASLPQVAPECPECRFPLTMAAADSGYRPGDRSGTTSTATPGGRSTPPVLPGSSAAEARARVHGSRGHRMRVTAWLLGVTAFLLLLAGLGALFTASSAGARSDRLAQTSLVSTLRAAQGRPPREGTRSTVVAAAEPSDGPEEVSVEMVDGLWFGAARSMSGTCFLLAGQVPGDGRVGGGTLGKGEACTGAHVRSRYEAGKAGKKR